MGEATELVLEAADEATTRAIAATLAGGLRPGDVVGLTGDLGAGKTRFVQGAAAELEDLGIEEVLPPEAVVFVEWADRVVEALPPTWLELAFHTRPDEVREIHLRAHGAGWADRLPELRSTLDRFRAHEPAPRDDR